MGPPFISGLSVLVSTNLFISLSFLSLFISLTSSSHFLYISFWLCTMSPSLFISFLFPSLFSTYFIPLLARFPWLTYTVLHLPISHHPTHLFVNFLSWFWYTFSASHPQHVYQFFLPYSFTDSLNLSPFRSLYLLLLIFRSVFLFSNFYVSLHTFFLDEAFLFCSTLEAKGDRLPLIPPQSVFFYPLIFLHYLFSFPFLNYFFLFIPCAIISYFVAFSNF